MVPNGVFQRSVLGPILWNVFYNSVLKLTERMGITLVAFSDDLAVIGVHWILKKLQQTINDTLEMIRQWMQQRRMQVAPQKMEAVMLTGRKKLGEDIVFTLDHMEIVHKPHVKQLGVCFDKNLTFGTHVRKTVERTIVIANALRSLYPRIRGPSDSKRRHLAIVATSTLLYAVPVWRRWLLNEDGHYTEQKAGNEDL